LSTKRIINNMLISESRLRQIIREIFLSEVGPSPGMDPTGATDPRSSLEDFYDWIPEDFITPGSWSNIAAAFADPTQITQWPHIPLALEAYENNQSLFNGAILVLTIVAAVPVAGKLAKVGSLTLKGIARALNRIKPHKALKSSHIEKAKKAIDKTIREISSPSSRGARAALTGGREILEEGLKKAGTYRVHKIFGPGKSHPNSAFINNGLMIAPGRATTSLLKGATAVERLENIITPITTLGMRVTNETRKSVIVRIPPGKNLNDILEYFDWTALGTKARTASAARGFNQRVPPTYIVGIWNPVEEIFTKGLGF
jgi:hypothetical protein